MKTLLMVCMWMLAISVRAAVVFDDGIDDHLSAGVDHPRLGSFRYADDFFLLSSATLMEIFWCGSYGTDFSKPEATPLAEESFEFSIFKRTKEVVNLATAFAPVATHIRAGVVFIAASGAGFQDYGKLYACTALLPARTLDAGQYIYAISAGEQTEDCFGRGLPRAGTLPIW